MTSRVPFSLYLIFIIVLFSGRMSLTDSPHSTTMMFSGLARFSARSSVMRPGSERR